MFPNSDETSDGILTIAASGTRTPSLSASAVTSNSLPNCRASRSFMKARRITPSAVTISPRKTEFTDCTELETMPFRAVAMWIGKTSPCKVFGCFPNFEQTYKVPQFLIDFVPRGITPRSHHTQPPPSPAPSSSSSATAPWGWARTRFPRFRPAPSPRSGGARGRSRSPRRRSPCPCR